MQLFKKWQRFAMVFLIVFLVSGCATTPTYYAFTPTVLSFQINASGEKTYGMLQEVIKNHPFRILKKADEDYAILATSQQSGFQKAGLFVGKILSGVSYSDELTFMVIPKEQETELQIAIIAFQRMPSFVEQITIDSKSQLYKQANYLAQEVKKKAESP